jgi:hypothetical protein
MEPASPTDIATRLQSNLQNYGVHSPAEQARAPLPAAGPGAGASKKAAQKDTERMIYGLKELKVGLNPRFILQTKGEYKGVKIAGIKKENVLDSLNFENLNLKSENIHDQKIGRDLHGVVTPSGGGPATATPRTDRKGNDTSCNASMI